MKNLLLGLGDMFCWGFNGKDVRINCCEDGESVEEKYVLVISSYLGFCSSARYSLLFSGNLRLSL